MNYETQAKKERTEMREIWVKNTNVEMLTSWEVRKMVNTLVGINKKMGRNAIKITQRNGKLDYKGTIKVYNLLTLSYERHVVFHANYLDAVGRNKYSVKYDRTLFELKENLFGEEEE